MVHPVLVANDGQLYAHVVNAGDAPAAGAAGAAAAAAAPAAADACVPRVHVS